jgi:hypothetical protein
MQQKIMDWKNLRQNRGQNVQYYTQGFRKRALTLGIPLYTQETLLKYIGRWSNYMLIFVTFYHQSKGVNLEMSTLYVQRLEHETI